MSKSRDEFCSSIKQRYPAISKKADAEYYRKWGDFSDPKTDSYSWFEALANALNKEMCREVPVSEHSGLFAAISASFDSGDKDIRKAIEVAFVENLFWNVPESRSGSYWASLPNNLKHLYIEFYHRTPF